MTGFPKVQPHFSRFATGDYPDAGRVDHPQYKINSMATASLMTLSLSYYHSSIKSVQRSVVDGLQHRLLNNVAIMIGHTCVWCTDETQ